MTSTVSIGVNSFFISFSQSPRLGQPVRLYRSIRLYLYFAPFFSFRSGCIELDFKEISYLVHFKAQSYESNNKATLESVGDDVEDIKKDQAAIQSRVANMEEKLDLILDIMQSRYKPPVDRL